MVDWIPTEEEFKVLRKGVEEYEDAQVALIEALEGQKHAMAIDPQKNAELFVQVFSKGMEKAEERTDMADLKIRMDLLRGKLAKFWMWARSTRDSSAAEQLISSVE